MLDVYKMAIQSIAEVFAVVAIFIGFANEEKIAAWERKQARRFIRWLHRRLNSNKKIVQWARPKIGQSKRQGTQKEKCRITGEHS